MSTKTKFKATFSNGQVATRSSEHEYGFAFCVTYPCVDFRNGESCLSVSTGFSGTRELAEKAASAYGYERKFNMKTHRQVTVGARPGRWVEIVPVEIISK